LQRLYGFAVSKRTEEGKQEKAGCSRDLLQLMRLNGEQAGDSKSGSTASQQTAQAGVLYENHLIPWITSAS